MKRFSIKSVLFLTAIAAVFLCVIVPAVLPFKPSLTFENISLTSVDQGDGTTNIAINGTIRNTGREWLRFLALHTDTSGYYIKNTDPKAHLRFEQGGIADYFDTGLGPGQKMPLTHTISIPHSPIDSVAVTMSIHVATEHAEQSGTKHGVAQSRTYRIDEP
ncbi:hypothetical protein [Stieleria mannarensis]|uniref:hypothetical protein n=1 Tax=Stieleria mannarensis TaxID=2755585 RepID=UPI0015FF15AB|nr:hypothetical protein [Rhodopirellula sp. JC639]